MRLEHWTRAMAGMCSACGDVAWWLAHFKRADGRWVVRPCCMAHARKLAAKATMPLPAPPAPPAPPVVGAGT